MKIDWKGSPTQERGIITALDKHLEWLLPWWWENLRAHCTLPVTLFDMGLTSEGRKWCEARMQVRDFFLDTSFVTEDPTEKEKWELIFTQEYLKKRPAWFCKSFTLLQTPYKETLWLDTDCKVMHPIDEIFSYAEGGLEIALPLGMSREEAQAKGGMTIAHALQITLPGEIAYNCGIIPYKWGTPLIVEWARAVYRYNSQFLCDQDVLIRLLHMKKREKLLFPHLPCEVTTLPDTYHWNFLKGENPEAHIIHYHSTGKERILQEAKLLDTLYAPNMARFT
ncbi:MAG: hypothetical protein MRY21_04410 [Simkaniaceae bacterium]|nr:hypothetical protein [Simkaniaceae bacterium]